MAPSFQRLKPQTQSQQREQVASILLDVSGSMADIDNPEKGRRIDLLREAIEILHDLRGIKLVAFNDDVIPLESISVLPEPKWGTDMCRAFNFVKRLGNHHVLITDGIPNHEETAIQAARGMIFDIVYVGPEPIPSFLKRLAQLSNGTLQLGKLEDPKLLSQSISGLLSDNRNINL